MRLFSFSTLFPAAIAAVWRSSAMAGTVPSIVFNDGNALYVQSVVGSGPDTAYLTIDLAGGPNVSWQYNFDPSSAPVDGWQMLSDISTADPNLAITATYYASFGEHLVNNFRYGNATGVTGKWDFGIGSYNASNLSIANPQGTTWTFPNYGIDQADLTNGELIGFVDQTHPTPTPVLSESLAAVPEPGSASLVAAASVMFLGRRRR